MVKMATPESVC